MAARRLAIRCLGLSRARPVVASSLVRRQSIFTKEREPPNGFLFNEKVIFVAFQFIRLAKAVPLCICCNSKFASLTFYYSLVNPVKRGSWKTGKIFGTGGG